MESRGVRDEIVIATKFTGSQTSELGDKVIQSNYGGNGSKNLHTSIERSLKNLRTSYVDVVSLADPSSLSTHSIVSMDWSRCTKQDKTALLTTPSTMSTSTTTQPPSPN